VAGFRDNPDRKTSLNYARLENCEKKVLNAMSEQREYAEFPSHTVSYEIMTNVESEDKERSFKVLATPQEIEQLAEQGHLIREALFRGEQLERLRNALDEVEAAEVTAGSSVISRSGRFGGWFPRYLMDKHAAFLELLDFQPMLSVARAVLGPFVRIRNVGGRVSYPGEPNQETHWHLHRRTVPKPLPAFFSFPHTVDCLIYLDELNDANGTLAIVPGSHLRIHDPLPADCFDDLPGQKVVSGPAGTCIIMHSNLRHRALPTRPDGEKRRVLILCYGPTWMRYSPFGTKPDNSLVDALLEEATPETKELLGVGGYQ
jgi:ectoine hydroxylase-related dioxygenase (phytanoyl-CoA dioxygenase family)